MLGGEEVEKVQQSLPRRLAGKGEEELAGEWGEGGTGIKNGLLKTGEVSADVNTDGKDPVDKELMTQGRGDNGP